MSLINNFRDAGVSGGRPRIALLCNILFLKIIDKFAEQENLLIKQLASWCRWNKIKDKRGEELLTILKKLMMMQKQKCLELLK